VKSKWGISFTVWDNKKNDSEIKLKIKKNKKNIITDNGYKNIYSVKDEARQWAKSLIKHKSVDAPQLTNPINVSEGIGLSCEKSLGFFHCNGNNVYYNIRFVGLYSSSFSGSHGFNITEDNFDRVISLFTARKLFKPNWINCKDEYMPPNENHDKYKQWVNDCHVYSLFDNFSNQSSLRNVIYKDKIWDIKNEFFWMKSEKESFMYKRLKNIHLSDKAKEVLDYASYLVNKSNDARYDFHKKHPEYQICNSDIGYAQLKWLWKECFPDEFKEFRSLWDCFQKEMKPLVFELGFLKD